MLPKKNEIFQLFFDFGPVGGKAEVEMVEIGYFSFADANMRREGDLVVFDTGWTWLPETVDFVTKEMASGSGAASAWDSLASVTAEQGVILIDPVPGSLGVPFFGIIPSSGNWSDEYASQRGSPDGDFADLQRKMRTETAQADRQNDCQNAILAWFIRNYKPVAPYAYLTSKCGFLPGNLSVSEVIFTNPEQRDRLVREVQAMDKYASCIDQVRGGYQPQGYAAIFDEAVAKLAEWQAAGGKTRTRTYIPSIPHIDGYPMLPPGSEDDFFDYHRSLVLNPNARSRVHLRKLELSEARWAAYKRERAQEEAEAKRRNQAIAQQWPDNQAAVQLQLNRIMREQQLGSSTSSSAPSTTSSSASSIASSSAPSSPIMLERVKTSTNCAHGRRADGSCMTKAEMDAQAAEIIRKSDEERRRLQEKFRQERRNLPNAPKSCKPGYVPCGLRRECIPAGSRGICQQ